MGGSYNNELEPLQFVYYLEPSVTDSVYFRPVSRKNEKISLKRDDFSFFGCLCLRFLPEFLSSGRRQVKWTGRLRFYATSIINPPFFRISVNRFTNLSTRDGYPGRPNGGGFRPACEPVVLMADRKSGSSTVLSDQAFKESCGNGDRPKIRLKQDTPGAGGHSGAGTDPEARWLARSDSKNERGGRRRRT